MKVLQDWPEGGRGKVKVQIGPGGEVADKLKGLAVLSQHCDRGPFRVTLLHQKRLRAKG